VAVVDYQERQLTLKLVYYGPPLSGKTSNLRALYSAVDKLNRGRLMTLDTRDDRTLFFDLMPIFFRTSGFSFRIKVYTVPGQPVHEATRKVVLASADGVVFVADSSAQSRQENAASWRNLTSNLATLGLERLPIVVQYNKRDLPDAIPLEEADRFGDPARPIEAACAKRGEGVVSTFFQLVGRAWDRLDRDIQLAQKLGVDSATFRAALVEHVGVAEPDRLPG
jgi:signal recognition particle receptor subunit beta